MAVKRSAILLAALVFTSIGASIDATAQTSSVSARMKRIGQEISLKLVIKAPAPPALILYLTMPESYKIIDSSPKADSYEPKKGMAKWLIRRPRPGQHILRVRFGNRIDLHELTGKIRYKDPETGKKTVIKVKK